MSESAGEAPSAAEESHKPAKKGGDIPFVAQLTPTDCGAASLASVLAYHGKHVPIHQVRAMLGGGRNGVNARQILTAARAFGFNARGVAVEPNKLRFLPRGSILHWELAHFVVFEGCTEKSVILVDPAFGRRELPMPQVAKSLSGVALVFEPGAEFVRQKPRRSDRLARYAQWMFGVRGIWGRSIAVSFFLQLLALAAPGLMSVVVDKVVPRGDGQLLYLVAAGFLTVASFYFLSTYLRSRLLLELRTKVESRMSMDFVEHLLALPYGFFQQRTTGDLMMRLSSQASIRELLTTGALSALLDGAMVLIYFCLLLGAAPILGLVALGLALVQVGTYLVAAKKNSRLVVEGLAAQSRLEGYQVEMLSGIETLKSMGATDKTLYRWADLYVNSLNRSIAKGELESVFQALIQALRFCGPLILILMGAREVLEGNLSLGAMLGLSSLGAGFLEPITNLVGTGMRLTQLQGYMERIEDVLDTPREIPREKLARGPAPRPSGAVSVEGLSFRYPSEPQPVLEGITFEVEPGECVAIVGASGSGKSTLARLLAGLYEPLAGSVSFDGKDLRSWDLAALRESLGIVTQDTRLFSGTIRDNVALFENALEQEAVEGACQLAALHETITAMPMGYETMLADGGSSLSGGQRQRLSLARALVRNPTVLVLDEATSALDTITEQKVQENLRALSCTRIIVAHRLSTIVEADKIVVLENGRIAGIGRHRQLVLKCAAYRDLVLSQGGHLAGADAPPAAGGLEGETPNHGRLKPAAISRKTTPT